MSRPSCQISTFQIIVSLFHISYVREGAGWDPLSGCAEVLCLRVVFRIQRTSFHVQFSERSAVSFYLYGLKRQSHHCGYYSGARLRSRAYSESIEQLLHHTFSQHCISLRCGESVSFIKNHGFRAVNIKSPLSPASYNFFSLDHNPKCFPSCCRFLP